MATFAISLSFVVDSADYDNAEELANRIGDLVIAERLASDYSTIDVELLEDETENEANEWDLDA